MGEDKQDAGACSRGSVNKDDVHIYLARNELGDVVGGMALFFIIKIIHTRRPMSTSDLFWLHPFLFLPPSSVSRPRPVAVHFHTDRCWTISRKRRRTRRRRVVRNVGATCQGHLVKERKCQNYNS